MSTLTQAQADIIISQAQYPHYWCNAQVCGCLGCVNKHGGVQVKGVTYSQWLDWKTRNPIAPDQPFYNNSKEDIDIINKILRAFNDEAAAVDVSGGNSSDSGSSCSSGD